MLCYHALIIILRSNLSLLNSISRVDITDGNTPPTTPQLVSAAKETKKR